MASRFEVPGMPLLIMQSGLSLGTRDEGFDLTIVLNPYYKDATDEQMYLAFCKSFGNDLKEIRNFKNLGNLEYSARIILKEKD